MNDWSRSIYNRRGLVDVDYNACMLEREIIAVKRMFVSVFANALLLSHTGITPAAEEWVKNGLPAEFGYNETPLKMAIFEIVIWSFGSILDQIEI